LCVQGCPVRGVILRVALFCVFMPEEARAIRRYGKGSYSMARVTVEDCLKNVDSRFTLVHLAVRRVLQLRHGAPPTMENTKGNKEVVLALREIAAENITVDNIRLIEESRPAPVEVAAPVDAVAERVELKEIMDEATSFDLSAEYEDADQLIEGDPDQQDRGDREED